MSKDLADVAVSLNKYIASCGVCSRRKADELIREGQISVNDAPMLTVSFKVMPTDVVRYLKKIIKPEEFIYIAVNKPEGVVTTSSDPQGRPTVLQLVQLSAKNRLFSIGRLDVTTTGLLLLTNDGELAQKLAHPRYKMDKTYHAKLHKPLSLQDAVTIRQGGVKLSDGFVSVDRMTVGSDRKKITIQLHCGRNRIIRRIFNSLGYHLKKLDRIGFGPITKKGLALGKWRRLTTQEINKLKKS